MKKMSKAIGIFMLGAIASFAVNVAAEAVISSGAVSYSNTTVSAALDELFSAVDINEKIGTTDISAIGDGTITGAINQINSSSVKTAMKNAGSLSWVSAATVPGQVLFSTSVDFSDVIPSDSQIVGVSLGGQAYVDRYTPVVYAIGSRSVSIRGLAVGTYTNSFSTEIHVYVTYI